MTIRYPYSTNAFDQSETGHFWLQTDESKYLRVVEFAGFSVPEDGLVLVPPFGGELAVWPDGRYAFTCPVPEDQGPSMVATHYSYVVEAMDGTSTVGSFALGEQDPEEVMPDFQSWSLHDILALEDTVGLIADLPGAVEELSFAAAEGLAVLDSNPEMGYDSFGSDVLEHVIKTSFES